jgi:hypothetical protein
LDARLRAAARSPTDSYFVATGPPLNAQEAEARFLGAASRLLERGLIFPVI